MLLISLSKIFKLSNIRYIVLFLFISSLIYSLINSKTNPDFAYYMLLSRAWQLLAGALVFLFPINIKKFNNIIQYICLILLALCVVYINKSMAWPGIYSVIPIAVTVMFLYSNANDTIISKNKVLNYIGKISYSLYLYHWPCAVLCAIFTRRFTFIKISIAIFIVIILAVISYHFIERRINKKFNFILYISVVLFFSIFGNYLHNNKKLPDSLYNDIYTEEIDVKEYKSGSENKTIYLIGDSHSRRLKTIALDAGKELDYNVSFVGLYGPEYSKLKDIIDNDISNSVFIISFRWRVKLNQKEFKEIIYKSTDETMKLLNNKGAKVIIFLQVPKQFISARTFYNFIYRFNSTDIEEINDKLYKISVTKKDNIKKQKETRDMFIEIANKYKNVYVFDPIKYMCKEKCLIGNYIQ